MANPEGAINTEQIQNEEVVKNRISGFGIKVGLGGEFLTTDNIPEPKVQTALTEFFAKKGESVDPTPLNKVSTEEREKATDYEPWRSWMDNWIKTAGEDTTNSSNARIAGMEALGITDVKGFATASQEDKDQQIKTLYERFFQGSTKVKELADALTQSARSADNTVSMRVLNERLQAIDSFLSSCGADSKEAITQHILMQGVAEANQATQAVFLKNAPRNINQPLKDNQPKMLTDLQGKYSELHPATVEPAGSEPVPGVPKPAEGEVEQKIQMISATATEKKPDHRNNEDAEFHNATNRAYGAFDGVSEMGEIGGEAARTASTFVEEALASFPDKLTPDFSEKDATEEMKRILVDAHQEVYNKGRKILGFSGMSTTASVVKVLEDGTAIIGNVGDSRVYVLRKSRLHEAEALEQLTLDKRSDFFSEQEDIDRQKRLSNVTKKNDFVDDIDREAFKERNGLGYVLGQTDSSFKFLPINPQVRVTKLEEGDILLLTTDGIHDNLTDKEIEAYLRKYQTDPAMAIRKLVQQAKAISEKPKEENMRAKPDDITATAAVVKK